MGVSRKELVAAVMITYIVSDGIFASFEGQKAVELGFLFLRIAGERTSAHSGLPVKGPFRSASPWTTALTHS